MAHQPEIGCIVLKKSGSLGFWNTRFLKATGLTVSIFDDPSNVSVAKHQFVCSNMTHSVQGNRWYFTLYSSKDNMQGMDFAIDDAAAFSALKDYFGARLQLVCSKCFQKYLLFSFPVA